MSADALLEFFTSPFYRNVISLLIAVGLMVIACLVYFVFSKRSNLTLEVDRGAAPWNFLMGTFLDSFLITLLFTAESIFYAVGNFAKDVRTFANSPLAMVVFLSPIFGFFAEIAISWIAIRRVIALRQWLGRNETETK
jgi:hypothetical protein